MTTVDMFTGLYAITDSLLISDSTLASSVNEAILGGAKIIQFRDKTSDHKRKLILANLLNKICRDNNVLFIINDDVQLAIDCHAHGVHLGRSDKTLQAARAMLGEERVIGASCYQSLELAEQAQAHGANYIAFGRFFPSNTKPNAKPANLELLTQAKKKLHLPIVAIGGINRNNVRQIINAGADMAAVIHGVFGQPDIRASAKAISDTF